MAHYVGLDVSVRHTSICIVDDVGKVVREARVTSEPEAIIPILTAQHLACRRVGLEAGPLSQWLFNALASAGLPVICVETRHMKAALAAQINKTDRNDARGIAQMMRVGLYRLSITHNLRPIEGICPARIMFDSLSSTESGAVRWTGLLVAGLMRS